MVPRSLPDTGNACRSLRELRKAVKAKLKAQEKPTESCASSECTTAHIPSQEEDEVVSKLTAAIGGECLYQIYRTLIINVQLQSQLTSGK